ncbi:MAG: aminotransferase class I/II-fold pyridoxal phosphate-dependent enzyme [Oligoflexia bacterium]|nr:aminotransferase class I/II-fold pyridoxal phosphate-dependent enzyme [Oligoflexia bacterium]
MSNKVSNKISDKEKIIEDKIYNEFSSETLLLHKGFDPALSVGAIASPIYPNSTYVFPSAKAGERAFELAFFPEKTKEGEVAALIYSRVNHPNAEIVEDRLVHIEPEGGAAATFGSGMSAISTTILALLSRGKTVVYSNPIYGGTDYFLKSNLTTLGCFSVEVETDNFQETKKVLESCGDNLGMLFLETPGNPTLVMTDIHAVAEIAKKVNPNCLVMVDNTFLGMFQNPFKISPHVDIIVYSATKFMGGHAQLVAGATIVRKGKEHLIRDVKGWRTSLGTIASPFVCWELENSLKTYGIRMRGQAERAKIVAQFLSKHKKISKVLYPSLLTDNDPSYAIYKKQCSGPGSIITFNLLDDNREKTFKFLDTVANDHIISLAVSLGGVETLIEHPASMTHSEVAEDVRRKAGITEATVRLSIGLEDPNDLVKILDKALNNY